MASVYEIIGELSLVLNTIEGVQSHVTEAGEKLQSARGVTQGISEGIDSPTLNEVMGLMNQGQENMEGVNTLLSGINERIQTYIGILSSS